MPPSRAPAEKGERSSWVPKRTWREILAPSRDASNRLRCTTSTLGSSYSATCLRALTSRAHLSHLYLFAPSKISCAVNILRLSSMLSARLPRSSDSVANGSYTLLSWPHSRHLTWLMVWPWNISSTRVRQPRLWPMDIMDLRASRSTASSTACRNSWLSSCWPRWKDREKRCRLEMICTGLRACLARSCRLSCCVTRQHMHGSRRQSTPCRPTGSRTRLPMGGKNARHWSTLLQ
mmetsp:Transcript_34156/g.75760  ORF Transcript_34156/g.75760 Transcript_34156/m.75760 type:complete len:234 (-) Transcript_34156:218-919(-)